MKYQKISIIVLALCLIGIQNISFSSGIENSSTIIVPDDYKTIQEAIDYANNSDTIFVKEGIYFESLIINKPINLIGENKETTIIESIQSGYVISVYSNWVNLDSIMIQNCNTNFPGIAIFIYNSNNINLSNLRLQNNNIGTSILNSDDISIYKNEYINNKIGIKSERDVYKSKNFFINSNIFLDNLQNSIYLSQIENSNILENQISISLSTTYNFGLIIEESNNLVLYKNEISGYATGIRVLLSDDIEISENIIQDNDVAGLYLYVSTANIHDNIITNNGLLQLGITPRTENGGIILIGRSPNKSPLQSHHLISKNIITNNKGYGLYIDRTSSTVKSNDFIQNTKDAFFFESLNIWSENYWNYRRILPKIINGMQKTPIGIWKRGIQLDLYPATYPNIEIVEKMQGRFIQEQTQYIDELSAENNNKIICTFVHGWLFNPVIKDNIINGNAIYIRCRDIIYDSSQAYIIKGFDEVSFRNGPFVRFSTFGMLGSIAHVKGFYFH